ncbi:MAG: 4a-hydroxytetrahydrobiopterin dehydratase [Alphaproteobacteria bacterium]|nr:4a-hydroxytetrahydrobiopterin dehydratase [Alphaproteobacteria bacterium]
MSRPPRMGAAWALERLAADGAQGWRAVEGRDAIKKTFRFGNFVAAFGWMAQIALVAERMDHHPEWFNVYDRVEATLSTHDAEGVTELDLDLARAMERAAGGS